MFEREEIPAALVKSIHKYTLDCYDEYGNLGQGGTSREAIKKLNDEEQNIIRLRYFDEKTQTESAQILGISQVQVSRKEKKALEMSLDKDAGKKKKKKNYKKLFSFQIGNETLEQLSKLTEAYLTTQLERGFRTLDFYKSLQAM